MNSSDPVFRILSRSNDVAPFVLSASATADEEKEALGFLPRSVFDELAAKQQLFVAVHEWRGDQTYAGHLLFGGPYPKAKVLQVCVAPLHRRSGLATKLVDELKRQLTLDQYISVQARVAEGLTEANAFWQRQGFYVQSVAPGGKARKTTIVVRSHELSTPQLFAASGLTDDDPLGLQSSATDTPIFLLDLNVLFDLGPRRERNQDALDLFSVARMGSCQLAISSELSVELERTATPGKTDAMQAYAKIFPTFPVPTQDEWDSLSPQLTTIVFPDRRWLGAMSANDVSDLRHLATAIRHGLTGLITNDGAVLAAAAALKLHFGIQVLSPTAFRETTAVPPSAHAFDTPSTETLLMATVAASSVEAVQTLLTKLGVTKSAQLADWAVVDSNERVCTRRGAWNEHMLVGYLLWPKWTAGSVLTARIAIDESQSLAQSAVRALLHDVIGESTSTGASQVRLGFPPRQALIREEASRLGFTGTNDNQSLAKVILNRIVTEANWDSCRAKLLASAHIELPESMPSFRTCEQQLQLKREDGNRTFVSLMKLEALLSPALFCLPGRPALISPVRRKFSAQLLAHLPQKSLLPQARASLFQAKHYLSDPRTLKHFKRGHLLLFYESTRERGMGAIIAIARILHAYLTAKDAIDQADLDPSVLDADVLNTIGRSPIKTVTVFDNVMLFPQPVPLSILRQIGCGEANSLISTQRINAEQLRTILAAGHFDD